MRGVKGTEDEIVSKIDTQKSKDFQDSNTDVIVDFSTCDRGEYVEFAREKRIPYACFSTKLSEKDVERFQNLS